MSTPTIAFDLKPRMVRSVNMTFAAITADRPTNCIKLSLRNCLLLMTMMIQQTPAWAGDPTIFSVDTQNGNFNILVRGKNFGAFCNTCEVSIHFNQFSHSSKIKQWRESSILIESFDVGLERSVGIQVISPQGNSNIVRTRLPPRIVPRMTANKYLPDKQLPEQWRSQIFIGRQSVGDEGVIEFNLDRPRPECGKKGERFARAELYLAPKSRFSKAMIVAQPSAACFDCSPLKVAYTYEPTGYLALQVHTYYQVIDGSCLDQKN